jgi:hypothetical protein
MKEKHQSSKLNAIWKLHLKWHWWGVFWFDFFWTDEATFYVNEQISTLRNTQVDYLHHATTPPPPKWWCDVHWATWHIVFLHTAVSTEIFTSACQKCSLSCNWNTFKTKKELQFFFQNDTDHISALLFHVLGMSRWPNQRTGRLSRLQFLSLARGLFLVNRSDGRSLSAERYPLRVSRQTFLNFDEVHFEFWRPLFTVSNGYCTADNWLWYKFCSGLM